MKKRKIMSIVMLSLLAVGLVSAALVNYLSNQITGTVEVSSPIEVEITGSTKGTYDNVAGTFSANLIATESFDINTTTTNLADVPITAILVEVKVPDFDGVGITYHHDDGTWAGDIPVCTSGGNAYYYIGPAGGFEAEIGYNIAATSTITTAQNLAPQTYNAEIKVISAANRVC